MAARNVNSRKELARNFHDKYSRQPVEIVHCMPSIQLIWQNMIKFLVFDRVEHTGSAYEKTNVGTDVDIDTIVVLQKGTYTHTHGTNSDNLLRSDELRNKLKSGLQKFINSIDQGQQPGLSGIVNVKMYDLPNSVALKLEVESPHNSFQKYSMDITPAIQVSNNGSSSIRIPVHRNPANEREALEWKADYAVDEKNLLRHGDENNGCRREVYRVCKAIRNRDPQLEPLRSYVIKCVLLNMMTKTSAWSRDNLGERVHDVMLGLRDGIRAGDIRACFNPHENVVSRLNEEQRKQVVNRLTILVEDDSKMFSSN